MQAKHKTRLGSCLLGGVILLLVPALAVAEGDSKSWGVNLSTGFYTDYMFRGKNVYEGVSIQPSATLLYDFGSIGRISGNAWAHLSGETNEPPERFTELDYTVSYALTLDSFDISAGHIFYTFPGDGQRIAETKEYFVGVSVATLLNPSLTFYNDYDEGEYQYYTLGFRETVPLPFLGKGFEFTPYTLFAFATNSDDGPVFYEDDGLVHIDVGASMDFELGNLYVSPNFNFTFEIEDGAENEFWFGIDIGVDV